MPFLDALPFIALPMLSGMVSGLTTDSRSTWYRTLNKPSFQPPPKAFPIVWPTLYAMMGYASYRIYQQTTGMAVKDSAQSTSLSTIVDNVKSALEPSSAARRPYLLYFTQLGINLCWTPLFFGMHRPDLSLMNITLLLPTLVSTITEFYKVDQTAALLLLPYLGWSCFAWLLNYKIVALNPSSSPLLQL